MLPQRRPCLRPLRTQTVRGSVRSIAFPTKKVPLHIPAAVICHYWDTVPPTPERLIFAKKFFESEKPQLIFTAAKLHQVTFTDVPEVAFMGRSNVGKSSLLNALMGAPICHTSKTPGRTRTMNAFAVGGQNQFGQRGRLTVLDMPGYGKGSREEWGREITRYLTERKELKRAFLLVNAAHGLKESDKLMLKLLRDTAIPHQIVLSKIDMFLRLRENATEDSLAKAALRLKEAVRSLREEIQPIGDGPPALGEIIACSAEDRSHTLGISNLRWSVLAATGIEPGEKIRLPASEPLRKQNDGQKKPST